MINSKRQTVSLLSLSAVLLILSFPKFNFWLLAWFALVPFFYALDGVDQKSAFKRGFFWGLLFLAVSWYWIGYVTIVGLFLLVAYFALFFGFFAMLYRAFSAFRITGRLLAIPAAWVALEFVRGHLFSGFEWVSLGHSQYTVLPVIQIADVTGQYGVSFLIVMVNVLIKDFCDGWMTKEKTVSRSAVAIVAVALGVTLGYGYVQLNQSLSSKKSIKVSVIQGNIDLETRWKATAWQTIIDQYLELSRLAARDDSDLIVWPETAFPGFLWEDARFFKPVAQFIEEVNTPLFFGAVTHEDDDFYNSAILYRPDGQYEKYDKIHLVLYGEYIPFRKYFPFLGEIIPIDDFSFGRDYKTFSLNRENPVRLSALICFEDTVTRLVRRFVRNGAEILVNISNDVWFRDSKEPFLHMQSAVFRSVENRRSMIRASNTGLSCFIDPFGRVKNCVSNDDGRQILVAGVQSAVVWANTDMTFYTRMGDVFAYFCCALSIILLGLIWKFRRTPQNS